MFIAGDTNTCRPYGAQNWFWVAVLPICHPYGVETVFGISIPTPFPSPVRGDILVGPWAKKVLSPVRGDISYCGNGC